MATLKDFVTQESRPLPVILLADASGSMAENSKIRILNEAVKDMIESFKEAELQRTELFFMSIIFGGDQASIHTPFMPVKDVVWNEINASGGTPMGKAFDLLTQILENKEKIPSRSYRPSIILVSDGQPNDVWDYPLEQLLKSDRGGKAFRFAMGIGDDADTGMLEKFLANTEQRVFSASDAREIKKFFRYVTMSVTTRSKSQNPNAQQTLPPISDDLDELDF